MGFQSIRVSSEWRLNVDSIRVGVRYSHVSNQLGSPASGDLAGIDARFFIESLSFQSIRVSSEWRQGEKINANVKGIQCFQSIRVSSEWRPGFNTHHGTIMCSFQSIRVSSEWRLGIVRCPVLGSVVWLVSNQLGSPASGDFTEHDKKFMNRIGVSNQLGSPASGDIKPETRD